MSNVSPSTRVSELPSFDHPTTNHLWDLDSQQDLLESNTALGRFSRLNIMEPESPTTPTMSSSSPTSSDHPLTPTSPTQPQYKSIWSAKSLSINTPFSKINRNTSKRPSLTPRRSTLELIRASPDFQSFSRTRASNNHTPESALSTSPANPSSFEEDTPMLTPPQQSTTHQEPNPTITSPILLTLVSQTPTQTSRTHPLQTSISHLEIPLVPLVSVTNGLAHPHFPRSILQYHLLTHDQLNSLALWYHQTLKNTRERYMYPAVIERPWMGWEGDGVELATKRRRFGRFIGLRGCESPTREEGVDGDEEEEGLAEKMEREWVRALRRAEEEERVREKVWRGRW